MPFKSGLEMIEETKEKYGYSAIILSGFNEFEYAKKAINFGVSEYILKPVNHEELKKAIIKSIKSIEMKNLYDSANENNKKITDITLISNNTNLSFYVKSVIEVIENEYMNKLGVFQELLEMSALSRTFRKLKVLFLSAIRNF